MEIQKRENDLVLGTFGRGFYVLDDYSPLREITAEALAKEAHIFPVKDALLYVERTDIGLRDKGHLGSSYFTTPNPKPGAVFTYYLKENIQTLKEERQEKEKETKDDPYPTLDQLRQEDVEEDPYLIFTIRNAQGEVVRHLKASATKGLKRLTWDMRHNTPAPVVGRYTPAPDVLFGSAELGHLAMPGTYTVSLSKFENGEVSKLTEPVSFDLNYLNQSSMPETDWAAYDAFVNKVADIRKAFSAANDIRGELMRNLNHIQSAILDMPAAPEGLLAKASELKLQLNELSRKMNGDRSLARRQFETPPSIGDRIGRCEYGLWDVTSEPTQVYLDAYRIAAKQFGPALNELKLIANEVAALEKQIEMNNAPYTPGRWPEWSGQ